MKSPRISHGFPIFQGRPQPRSGRPPPGLRHGAGGAGPSASKSLTWSWKKCRSRFLPSKLCFWTYDIHVISIWDIHMGYRGKISHMQPMAHDGSGWCWYQKCSHFYFLADIDGIHGAPLRHCWVSWTEITPCRRETDPGLMEKNMCWNLLFPMIFSV